MQIHIPPAEQQQLAAMAAQRGFATAEEYASSLLINAVQLEAFAELSTEDMDASVESIETGLRQAKDGLGVPAEKAINEVAAKYQLKLPECYIAV